MSLTIFLDESYDQPNKDCTVLGVLYVQPGCKLLAGLRSSKHNRQYIDANGEPLELKYNNCIDKKCLKVARDAVDAFIADRHSRFACIVIEKRLVDRNRFGRHYEPDKIIDARIYKKFAELLLRNTIGNSDGAVLLADSMTRCQGDLFLELLKELFSTPGQFYSKGKSVPLFRHVQEVPSHVGSYELMQICDLFCGCVLNENVPVRNPRSGKNRIREYLCRKLRVDSLSRELWTSRATLPKGRFNVWYWTPQS